MAAAATAVKLHVRLSRMQEAAIVFQEKAWVQEVVGEVAKRGQFLFDVISGKSFNHAPAAAAAAVGSSGLLLPQPRPTKAAGIIPNDPVESLVANLAARRENGSSKLKLQSVQLVMTTSLADGSQGVNHIETELKSSLVQSMEDDDYKWETDPNGGWLASFS
jgi:hypothetical protein